MTAPQPQPQTVRDLDALDTPAAVRALAPWFHNLHLPDGTQTAPHHPLGDFPKFKWDAIAPHLPEDLSGWTALDVGCNAGYYAFELARRGARVRGIDADPRYLRQAEWAACRLGLEDRVRFERRQVYDLAREDESYDLVLFLGVFYHLRYPLLGLDAVARKVRRLLVFQTLSLPGDDVVEDTEDRGMDERSDLLAPGWPKMAFVEHKFAGDESNWWIPNRAGVEAMLRSTGLRVVASPAHEFHLCEPDPHNPSPVDGWNRSEYLSATGAEWIADERSPEKFRPVARSIESRGRPRDPR